MNQFSISQLAQFSGIKPHTIRMWEQRYNALIPNRSKGNTRYYDNSQLRRLLNIVSLIEADFKVSEVSAMKDKALFKLVEETQTTTTKRLSGYFVSQLIAAGMSYDEPQFDKIFSHCLLRYGMKDAYVEVIYPAIARIGVMWCSNALPPANEHFISNLFRQKLFTAIDSLPNAKPGAESWLLFSPENEFHEIGLLLSRYLIRLAGNKVIYLGNNLPLESVFDAVQQTKSSKILLFLVHNDWLYDIQIYINKLHTALSDKKIYVAGNERIIGKLTSGKKMKLLKSVQDLEEELKINV